MEKATIMINNETASVQNINRSGTVTNISSPMKFIVRWDGSVIIT
jgi:hypothetical protein